MSFQSFDPTAYERAAQAMKVLNESPHAQQALLVQIKEAEARKAEYEAAKKQKEINRIRIEQEEKRRTQENKLEVDRRSAEYQDRLNRNRHKDQLLQNERSQQRIREQMEESNKRIEEEKRKTMEFQQSRQIEIEKKKSEFKADQKAQIIRKTHDLKIKEIQLVEEQRRETSKQLLQQKLDSAWKGFNHLMSNRQFVVNFFLYTVAISSAYYVSKSSISVMAKLLQSKFGQPSLIRETSRLHYKQFYKYPLKIYDYLFSKDKAMKSIFQNIVLEKNLEQQLQQICYSLINKRKNYVPLRNFMFHGPPGTGKTLFAKSLAQNCGMDYAIMTGADISPLQESAITELHKVFDWANQSRKGMILFIDEADAFFRQRQIGEKNIANANISENQRNAINAFLYRTGTPSKKFLFVLATNSPEQLDKALIDRTDQILFFGIPKLQERKNLINLYFAKYFDPQLQLSNRVKDLLYNPVEFFFKKKFIKLDTDINQEFIDELAQEIDGFSARQVEKFVIACYDSAFSQQNPILDQKTIRIVLENYIQQYKQEKEWIKVSSQQLQEVPLASKTD